MYAVMARPLTLTLTAQPFVLRLSNALETLLCFENDSSLYCPEALAELVLPGVADTAPRLVARREHDMRFGLLILAESKHYAISYTVE